MIEDRFDNHVLLPPVLADILFDLENFGAKTILLKFINKIKSIKADSLTFDKENPIEIEEEEEWEDINNADLNAIPEPASETSESTKNDNENLDHLGRTFELKFRRILKFLWGAIHQEKLVTRVSLHPCSLPSTMAWLDKVHDENLKKKVIKNVKNLQNNYVSPAHSNSITDFQNVATLILRLSNTLENHQGLSPSPQIEKKFTPQYKNPVNRNDFVHTSFGGNVTRSRRRHRHFKSFFSSVDPRIPVPNRDTHPLLKQMQQVSQFAIYHVMSKQ